MYKLIQKCKDASQKMYLRVRNILTNTDGDQITGWLIVVLLVVVVGAFFLNTYKGTIIIAAVIAYRIAIKNEAFKMTVDTNKLKIPIVGNMLERMELSRFCRNLSAMQKSGITLVSSLKIVDAAVKNQKIAKEVMKACRLVEISGMNLAAAMARAGKFPPMMLQLIEIGIGSGKITEVLDKIAVQYEKEVDTSLKRITSLIEPILIVVVGLLAGTVVISIFLPMFSMVDTF